MLDCREDVRVECVCVRRRISKSCSYRCCRRSVTAPAFCWKSLLAPLLKTDCDKARGAKRGWQAANEKHQSCLFSLTGEEFKLQRAFPEATSDLADGKTCSPFSHRTEQSYSPVVVQSLIAPAATIRFQGQDLGLLE